MARPIAFDRDKLHARLWHQAGRRHVFTGSIRVLAAETGISYFHLTRIIQDFVADGRLHPLSRGLHRLQSFRVEDPVYWNIDRRNLAGAETAKAEIEALSESSRTYKRKPVQVTPEIEETDELADEPEVA